MALGTILSAVSSPNREELREILQPDIQLAIWERQANRVIAPALDAMLAASHPIKKQWVNPSLNDVCKGFLANLHGRADLQPAFEALAEDILSLAEIFRQISGREHLRVRFERVEDDACALFHLDTLPIRMLCTYAGPGTQWLDEENVRRDQLGSQGRSLDEANAAIVIDQDEIHTVPVWNVLIFKGRRWEGHGHFDGLVHRSAPVRSSRDHRLRLTIDFSDSCGC